MLSMMLPVVLIALMALKHFVASYPLQCSYTVKGLGSSNWLLPMLARCSIHGAATIIVILSWWWHNGEPMRWSILAIVAGADMLSHFVIDRVKVSSELLGKYQVASPQELAQIAIDYQSKDASVVAAAQAESDSNKYFWWVDGGCHLLYGLVGIAIACLAQ